MRRLIFAAWLILIAVDLACAGLLLCRPLPPSPNPPIACPLPPPIELAHPLHNYGRNGSCLHCAVEDLLLWQGLNDKADYWRSHYSGGANVPDIVAIADKLGLRHAETEQGDESFLDFCAAHRLGAAIYWQAEKPHDHAIVFEGYEGDGADEKAVLLGVNRVEVSRMPKADFLRAWHACDGGAFTIIP